MDYSMGHSQYKDGAAESCRIVAKNVMVAPGMILMSNDGMFVVNIFLNAIRRHDLVPSGSRVLVAVSGGADSLALLHLLRIHQLTLNCRLHVATLDHRLRGDAGAADADYVAALAREWDLPVTVGVADVPALAKQRGIGIEAAARQARYDFLADAARETGSDRVAVAHHADDQAETVLMRLLRGTGVEGLAGMVYSAPLPEHPDLLVIRPLLGITRQAIEAYCAEHQLQPRHDSTNEDTRYTRNHLRREVLPYLTRFYPQVKRSLTQLGELAAVENNFAEQQLAGQLLAHITESGGRVFLPRQHFRDAHPALQRRFVRWAADQLGATDDLAYTHIVAAVEIMLNGALGAVALLPGGARLRLDYDAIVVEPSTLPPALPPDQFLMMDDGEISAQIPGETILLGGWVLHAEVRSQPEAPPAPGNLEAERRPFSGACLALQPDDSVILRARRAGDRLLVETGDGERHTRRISRWMIDSKIPQAVRQFVPLLVVNDQIAAVVWGRRWKVSKAALSSAATSREICLWLVNRNE